MVEPENAPRRVDASLAALSLLRAWTQAEAEALHATATGAAWVEPAEAARVRAASQWGQTSPAHAQALTAALAELAHDLLAELAARRDTTIEELLDQYALLELRLAEADEED